jgi:high-affinity Fe2+/Pb2+ permease
VQDRDTDRLNRELIELLNELRVALPGVQVLFAFLLAVPFTQRFEDVSGAEKWAFFGSFLCTAAASVLLIAPSAHHRLRWREHDKEHILVTGNRLAIAGTAFLALAMTGVVFLISDLLFGIAAAIPVAAAAGAAFAWFWYALPLSRRLRMR